MMPTAAVLEVEPVMTAEMLSGIGPEELALMLETLPEELRAAAVELIEEAQAEKIGKLRELAKKLEGKRDRSVRAKREIESRWAEDKRQLLGIRRNVKASRTQAADSGDEKLPPGLNLTASRSMIWSARITNMMVPGASGQPWSVQPTPSPTVIGPDGVELEIEQAKVIAEDAAGKMAQEIKDQWAECHVPQQVRLAAADMVEIGTGILCGPENYRRKKRKFKKLQGSNGRSVIDVQVEEKTRPQWRRVDPRYFFPEMVDSIDRAQYAFEVIPLTAAELKELAQTEGFKEFANEFHELIEENPEPDLGEWALNVSNWNAACPYKDAVEGRYAVWKFVGYLGKTEAEILGCECDDELEREEQMIEVWFCEGKILKAEPYILDGANRLPYYVASLFKLDDTMFGGSLPWRARDAQRSIHALWHALQHNVAMSAGTQIGIVEGLMEPMDGDWQVLGQKTWRMLCDPADLDKADIRRAMSFALIPNNAQQIMEVLKFRIESFDEEINLPLVAQGQPSEAVPTSSGLAMLMNAANIAQKDIAQSCEDNWLVPMLESAYAWNMLHSDDDSIKGDFDCVATLTSDNVFKDMRAQRLLMLHNLRAQDQELQIRVDPEVLYSQLAQALEVDASLFRTEDEVKQIQEQQAQSQPQDPNLIKAQIMQMQFEAEQQQKQADNQFREEDRALDHQERMRELEIREREAQTREFVAQSNERIKRMELEGRFLADASKEQTENAKIGVNARLKAQEMAEKRAQDALEIKVESPNPRLA